MGVNAAPPAARTNLRSNALWMVAANVCFFGARFGLVLLLAKISTLEIQGHYQYALAFCLPTVTACRYSLRTLQTTDARNQTRLSEYMAFNLSSTFIAAMVIVGLVAWEREDWFVGSLILAVGLWQCLESISEVFIAVFLRRERADLIARAYVFQAVTMLILFAAALLVTDDVRIAVLGVVITTVARQLLFEWPAVRRLLASDADGDQVAMGSEQPESLVPHWHWPAIRRLLVIGAPLAAVTFLIAYADSIPRYVLNDRLGPDKVGIFGALYTLANAQGLFILAVSQSLSARLARLFVQRKRKEFVEIVLRASAVAAAFGFCGVAIVAVWGEELLELLFSAEYAAEAAAFQILMIAGCITAVGHVLGTIVTSMRKFFVQAAVQCGRLAIIYAGSLWAVASGWGVEGVSWVVVVAACYHIVCYVSIAVWGLNANSPQTS